MPTTSLPAHRNSARQLMPGGAGVSMSADWEPWHKQLSDASVLPEQFFNP